MLSLYNPGLYLGPTYDPEADIVTTPLTYLCLLYYCVNGTKITTEDKLNLVSYNIIKNFVVRLQQCTEPDMSYRVEFETGWIQDADLACALLRGYLLYVVDREDLLSAVKQAQQTPRLRR